MSFVGCSSIIYSLEDNSEGAKILDVHAIKQHLKKEDIPLKVLKTRGKMDETEYPFTYFFYLSGLSSYDDSDYFLIDRVGYEYNSKDFLKLWKNISKYCEPFYFYHLPYDTCIPKTVFDVLLEGEESVYKIVCVEGKVEVYCTTIVYTDKVKVSGDGCKNG